MMMVHIYDTIIIKPHPIVFMGIWANIDICIKDSSPCRLFNVDSWTMSICFDLKELCLAGASLA